MSVQLSENWLTWMIARHRYGYFKPFICYTDSRFDGWYKMARSAPHLSHMHPETRCQERWRCWQDLFKKYTWKARKVVYHVRFTPEGRKLARALLVYRMLKDAR